MIGEENSFYWDFCIYCMLSNKVQSQTFDKVRLYLPEAFFPNPKL